eukprot:GABU01009252.1.p2 GENE.GABU01009252.1~~GABU01009252.1.p2  ORF type:complete len:158 (+),score=47.53 GABU01009252.1:47-475(+)
MFSSLTSGFMGLFKSSTTSGDDFIKNAAKLIGEKTFLVQFSKNDINKDLDDLDVITPSPMLVYLHDGAHPLTRSVLKNILQNKEIAGYVVGPVSDEELELLQLRTVGGAQEQTRISLSGQGSSCIVILQEGQVWQGQPHHRD